MPTLFNIDDKIRLKLQKSYIGVVTRITHVPECEGIEEHQLLNLNGSSYTSQFPSYLWEKVETGEPLIDH